LATIVYGQYGLDGRLTRDNANLLYAGQQLTAGIPPYVSVFNHTAPLPPLLAGFAVSIADAFGCDDLRAVRLLFLLLGILAVSALYRLGEALFSSERPAIFAALTFLGFAAFASHAAYGPQKKVPMMLFVVLSLLMMVRRRWFRAGFLGSAAMLCWQPTGVLPLINLWLACAVPRGRRLRACLLAVSGTALPVAIVVAYYGWQGALGEMLDGAILFNLLFLDRDAGSWAEPVVAIARAVGRGYTLSLLPIVVGLATVWGILLSRRAQYRTLRETLSLDRFAPLWLFLAAATLWSLIDFQGAPDFFVFLPAAALGFGALLDLSLCHAETELRDPLARGLVLVALVAGLLMLSEANVLRDRKSVLREQKATAARIASATGRDGRLVSVGAPEILTLLRRPNPSRYLFITDGIDRAIEARHPGGFDGWLQDLKSYDPTVILFGTTEGKKTLKLLRWIRSSYRPCRLGRQVVYVRAATEPAVDDATRLLKCSPSVGGPDEVPDDAPLLTAVAHPPGWGGTTFEPPAK
jgi:hypothetical protein